MSPGTVLALGVLCVLLPSAAAAEDAARAGSRRPAAPARLDPAAVLANLEIRLLAVAGAPDDIEEARAALASALLAARGRAIGAGLVDELARSLVEALATASLDAESAERLAQDLYAGLNHAALDGREALMLIEDVSLILRGAGALGTPVEDVVRALGMLGSSGSSSDAKPLPPSQTLSRLTRG